ncbi:hypothetical protein MY11210_007848 [Beauveria gryllotalpidicola]
MADETNAIADEIERLKRVIEQETRRADREKLRADEQTLRAHEQELRADEEKLRADEQKLRAHEQELRADEEKLRADEQRRLREQAEQNTAAINAALLREREERNKMILDQPLEDYLKRVHVLNYHLPRLLPPPKKSIPTLSEGQPSKSTTHGRTEMIKKFYPLHIRKWTKFPELCQQHFNRIRDALGTRRLFPSASEVDFSERSLLEQIPKNFVESEAFLSASRSSFFLHETLERPVQRIINAYLSTSGHKPQLYFDCHSAGWLMRAGGGSSASSSQSERRSGSSQNSGGTETKTGQRPKKILPDCLVLRMEMLSSEGSLMALHDPHEDEDVEAATRAISRVTLGEHKAFHRLRAAMVSKYLENAIPDDFMVRLAWKASRGQAVPGVTDQNTTGAAGATPSTNIPGVIFFAYALAQTFHYMVTSGLEFGYMAAGESLSFLRIPRDDPTTLLYYTQVFPQYCRAAGASTASDHAASDAADDAAVDIDELAIAKLCGLSLLAFESPVASPRQVSIQISKLAQFPKLPLSLSADSAASSPTNLPSRDSSSEGRRRRRDERGDYDDEGDDSGRRGRSMTHRPRNPSPLKKQSSTPGQQRSDADADGAFCARVANGSQPGRGRCLPSLPSPFDPASFKPIRPYCTHLCLRSLVQGDYSIDHDCPNVLLHLEAARRIGGPAADGAGHPIGPAKLAELVQLQLLNNIEQDCECLLSRGLNGAIGCLFRVTVTGFGYTLVAKGVQSFHAHRLRHEAAVYKQLAAQQGILIPVCVGIVKLRLPYLMSNSKLITHMLLLSYAGTPLYSPALRRRLKAGQVDVDAEASRTLKELQALGVEDDDDTSNGNLTWCASACRVMKIDFDHVRLREELPAPKKRPAHGPPPEMWDECRQKRRRQQPRHLTVASLLLA